MRRKISFKIYTFGCRVNQAESEFLKLKFLENGLKQEEKKYDVFVINTCAVTHKAEREARQLIYQEKRRNPDVFLVVTGCAATYWKKNNIKINGIDLLVDNINKQYLVDIIKKRLKVQKEKNKISILEVKDKYFSSKRAMVKIQDGCDRFCTYCIVPYLRGLPSSPKIKEIVEKVKIMENTVSEIIYTAVNTEDFGKNNNESLIDLIKNTLEKTKIKRLSFGSIHPWSITKDFLNFYERSLSKSNRFIHFFHIPIQSASNNILQLMKRGYTREELHWKFDSLYRINPEALLATDIIVGFLEESEKDFEDTYNFLKKSPISKFHVFRFSVRKNTAAFYLKKRLKEPAEIVKKRRAKILRELSEKKLVKFKRKFIGKTREALFLDKKMNDFQEALLHNQLPIMVKVPKYLEGGEIRRIKVIGLKNGTLTGKLAPVA